MNHPNERKAISNLQRYLRQLSYHNGTIPAPPIDGVFDADTAASLKAFQASEGLPPTGVANYKTWTLLYQKYLASVREYSAPVPIAQFPRISPGYALRIGDENFLVQLIQYALRELEIIYYGFETVPQTGVYDEATATAVKKLQEKNFLPPTGEVDRATWDALANAYNRTFSGFTEQ